MNLIDQTIEDLSDELTAEERQGMGFAINLREKMYPQTRAFARMEERFALDDGGQGNPFYTSIEGEVDRVTHSFIQDYPACADKQFALDMRDGKPLSISAMREVVMDGLKRDKRHMARKEPKIKAAYEALLDSNELGMWPRGWLIDPRIRIMMLLSELYTNVEGDLWQIVCATLDIGLKPLQIMSDDDGLIRKVKGLLDQVDMQEVMEANWLNTETYGNAFPITIWDATGEPQAIWNIKPEYISIGLWPWGNDVISYDMTMPDMRGFYDELLQQKNPAIVVNSLSPRWDEWYTRGRGLIISQDSIYHIHVKKFNHQRYAIPPIARAFRLISTRQILEEMIRGTIEGITNQLWTFVLATQRPGEIDLLDQKINNALQERSGAFAWRVDKPGSLEINQHLPGTVDQLMATETYMQFTQGIFRAMGISVRLISGESPGSVGAPRGEGGGGGEVDIKVLTERVQYQRELQIKFVNHYLMAVAKRQNDKALERALRLGNVKVKMEDMIFQQEFAVKNRIAPLLAYGLMSPQSALAMVGLDYAEELRLRKKANDIDKFTDIMKPMPQFTQTAVKPDGGASTTSQTGNSEGRRDNAEMGKP